MFLDATWVSVGVLESVSMTKRDQKTRPLNLVCFLSHHAYMWIRTGRAGKHRCFLIQDCYFHISQLSKDSFAQICTVAFKPMSIWASIPMTRSSTSEVLSAWITTVVHLYPRHQQKYLFIHLAKQNCFFHTSLMSVKLMIRLRIGRKWLQFQAGWGGLKTKVSWFLDKSFYPFVGMVRSFLTTFPRKRWKGTFLLQSTYESKAQYYRQPT